jgi:hypothetical protein
VAPGRGPRGQSLGYDRAVNPEIIFPLWGALCLVWGSVVAIFNNWSARWGSKIQRIYGRRASAMVTPPITRVTGVCLAAGGLLFVVLGIFHVLPDHA